MTETISETFTDMYFKFLVFPICQHDVEVAYELHCSQTTRGHLGVWRSSHVFTWRWSLELHDVRGWGLPGGGRQLLV